MTHTAVPMIVVLKTVAPPPADAMTMITMGGNLMTFVHLTGTRLAGSRGKTEVWGLLSLVMCLWMTGSLHAQGRLRMQEEADGSVTITNVDSSSAHRSVDNKTYYQKVQDGGDHVLYTDSPDRYSGWQKFLEGRSRSGSRFKDYIKNISLYDDEIRAVASQQTVSPALVKAIMMAESAFNPNALSPAGAQGLMQLIPSTARAMGVTDVWNARQNIQGGTKFLKQMLDRFEGNVRLAVAAYNAGPRNVEKYDGIPPFDETVAYVERVTDLFERFQANDLALSPQKTARSGVEKAGSGRGGGTGAGGAVRSTSPATPAQRGSGQ